MSDADPSAMDDQRRIDAMVEAGHPSVLLSTLDEAHVASMVSSAAMGTRRHFVRWSCVRGLEEGWTSPARSIGDTENPAAALTWLAAHFRSHPEPTLAMMLELGPFLQDAHTARALRELVQAARETGSTLVMIDQGDELPDAVSQKTVHLEIGAPDADEIEAIIKTALRRLHQRTPIDVEVRRSQLEAIVRNLRGLSRVQIEQVVAEVAAEDRRFDGDDIGRVLSAKRRRLQQGGTLEFVEAPTSLEEVGGLGRLKEWLSHRRGAFIGEGTAFGLEPPRGVLLLGVQGAGKSLSAKAIATAWQLPLIRLDPGSLYDRYVGESEKRLRRSLQQAELMAPTVLWVDEIEKGFASAAAHSTDGGLSQRMFGTLLTWMQDHTHPVFLVATANNIDALPPELLRKGRFDEIFFVDLPGEDARRIIFQIHLRKRRQDPLDFELHRLVEASEGYSGSEIEQAVLSALHRAWAERRDDRAGGEAKVTTEMLLEAIETSPPLSVTMREKIAELRRWAADRCVPAE